jgi:thiol-disulfide isomerase/thioredoxin
MAVCLGFALAAGCKQEPPPESKGPAPSDSTATPKETASTADTQALTGREVLGRMAAVYRKASSYADAGTVHLVAEAGDKKIEDVTANFALTMVRPNKVRIEAYHAMLVCDGKQMSAAINDLRGQVLVRPAPETLNLKTLDIDLILASALTQEFAGVMPQIMLLFSDRPIEEFLRDAEEPELAQPAAIDGHDCYRVKIKGPDDMATFWIDQKTYLLRRFIPPTSGLRRSMSQQGPIDNVSLVADFTGARVDTKIDPKVFAFEAPADAETVKFFVPPAFKAVMAVLGKPAPAFKFTDLDGQPVTSESLAGKVAVLDFWATWCEPCRQSLPELEKARERFKSNPKVAFYAISVDEPKVENKDLVACFERLKVDIPILREPDRSASAFKVPGIPATFVIDGKGVVQDFEEGFNPAIAEELPAELDKLLAGENIYEPLLKRYQDQIDELRDYAEKGSGPSGETKGAEPAAGEEKIAIPEVKILPRSEPATLKLTPLWKCAEVKSPGNILAVGGKNGPVRLLVVDNWNSVAEVGLDGKLVAVHKIDLDEKAEFVCNLRTFTAGEDRYVAAFATGGQRFHLLDSHGKQILTYPEDALKSPHSGIADVQLGDLDGDGTPKIYVGYFGVVGVQAVSLDGKRLWSNRGVANVTRLAIGPNDEKKRGTLVCATVSGSPVMLDADGKTGGEIGLPGQALSSILAADLLGDGEPLWCGLTASRAGKNLAVGFSLRGELFWQYVLPDGVQPRPIEPIVAGQIHREGPGQWILPGTDGSIQFLSADGKLLDTFNYGAALQGLATIQIDGQAVLVVSSANGLEAWKVQ